MFTLLFYSSSQCTHLSGKIEVSVIREIDDSRFRSSSPVRYDKFISIGKFICHCDVNLSWVMVLSVGTDVE